MFQNGHATTKSKQGWSPLSSPSSQGSRRDRNDEGDIEEYLRKQNEELYHRYQQEKIQKEQLKRQIQKLKAEHSDITSEVAAWKEEGPIIEELEQELEVHFNSFNC